MIEHGAEATIGRSAGVPTLTCAICGGASEKMSSYEFRYGNVISETAGTKAYSVVQTPASMPICDACVTKMRKSQIWANLTMLLVGIGIILVFALLVYLFRDSQWSPGAIAKFLLGLVALFVGLAIFGGLFGLIAALGEPPRAVGEDLARDHAAHRKDPRFAGAEYSTFWSKHDYDTQHRA